MVKYVLAALALKAFSLNDATKKAYRSIGNIVGQRARQNTGIDVYVERGDLFVALCKKYGAVPAYTKSRIQAESAPRVPLWNDGVASAG